MRKKVTLRDLSEKLNLSPTAVSKALRGHDGVSEKTRQLVVETAKAMNYAYVPINRSLSPSSRGNVAILVDKRDLTESHTMTTSFWLDKALRASGIDAALLGVPEEHLDDEILGAITSGDCLAIFMFSRFSQHFVEELLKFAVPVIGIDHDFSSYSCDSVLVNDELGAFQAVEHLVKNGHTLIGYIGDRKLSVSFRARHQGYLTAIEYWGLEYHPEYDFNLRFRDQYGNIDYSPIVEHIAQANLPTAFFCANDAISYVLNNAINSLGIRIPDQISIVGFDNLDSSQWQYPPLTTVDYPREHIALCAVDMLLWRLEHLDAPTRRTHVRPSLIVRHSVSPPPKR